VKLGPIHIDWFGWRGYKSLPKRGPRWFISRGANFQYIVLGGICSVVVPWFRFQEAWDRGWRAGYEAGCEATRMREER
jgi:hypothetical protein